MTEDQIIKQIKLHPVLYDTRLTQYRDLDARNIAWEDIARKLNSNIEDVKTKWAKIRNCYTNALKRRHKNNMQDTRRTMPWKYQKQMEFLLPHLKYKNRRAKTNISILTESVKDEVLSSYNNEFDTHCHRPVSPVSSPQYVSPIEDDIDDYTPVSMRQSRSSEEHVLKEFVDVIDSTNEVNYKRSVEMDATDHFFLSMSQILKRLPREDQADIKFELHKLIYGAEKRQRKNNSLYQTP